MTTLTSLAKSTSSTPSTRRRRFSSTGITVVSLIVALALLALGVFALAGRSRTAADASLRLHAVDDAQQRAVQVENQLRLLVVTNGLDEAFDEIASTLLSEGEAAVNQGLADLAGALSAARIESDLAAEADAFTSAATATLAAARTRDLAATDAELTNSLVPRAGELRQALDRRRDNLTDEIESANAVLTVLRTFTTFVVVYLVPTAGLLAYRSLRAVPLRERRLRARLTAQQRHSDDTNVGLGAVVSHAKGQVSAARNSISVGQAPEEKDLLALAEAERQLQRSSELIAAAGHRSASSYTDVDLVQIAEEIAREYSVSSNSLVMRALIRSDLSKLELVLREMIVDAVAVAGPAGVGITVLTRANEAIATVSHHSPPDISHTLAVVFDQGSAAVRQIATRHEERGALLLAQTVAESMGASLTHERADEADHLSLTLPLERRAAISEADTARKAPRAAVGAATGS